MMGREYVRIWVVLMVLAYVGHKLSMYVFDVLYWSLSLFKLLCAWFKVYACFGKVGCLFWGVWKVWEA